VGGISIWHWIILFVVFILPALVIVWLAWFLIRRSRPVASPLPRTIESRLQELDLLRAKGTITLQEFEQQRAIILREL